MTTIRPSRRIERSGVNALRALLEEHNHLVQEIDGSIDHGEDLFVILTRDGRRTGHVVAVQVKSGKKYKRANGYAIPIDDHYEDWRDSRIPVIGVVYDRDANSLYWINLTQVLKGCSSPPTWVPVPLSNVLMDRTVKGFVAQLEMFIDTEGMRVRESSASDVFESAMQARIAHAARHEDDDSEESNPIFEPLVDFALRHERIIKRLLKDLPKYLLLSILGLVMAYEWPYQVKFVETFSDMSPIVWVVNLYLFTYFLALVVFFEFKAGRVPRFTGSYLTLILSNFYVNPFFVGDGSDTFWGTCWIIAGVFVPSLGYKIAIIWYVRLAIDRRRRRAASYVSSATKAS